MKLSWNLAGIGLGIVSALTLIFGGGLTYGRAIQQQKANQQVALAEGKAASLQSELAAARSALAQAPVNTDRKQSVTEGDVIGIRMWHEDCAYSEQDHGVNCPTIRAEILLLDIEGTNAKTGWSEVPPDFLMSIDWSWHCDLKTTVCEPPL